jgi:hypothetical protein
MRRREGFPDAPDPDSSTGRKLSQKTAAIHGVADRVKKAESLWDDSRGTKWFREGVVAPLKVAAGPGEPCMYCDAGEASDVEHFKPKGSFPELAFEWGNYLWVCGVCNSTYKGVRFPPVTEPGDPILHPYRDNVWDHLYIDEFGHLNEILDEHGNKLPRAVSTLQVLGLDREALNVRRHDRLRQLKDAVNDSLARYRSGEISAAVLRQRMAEWIANSLQPDVAQYFLQGPGRTDAPFAEFLRVIDNTP